jgi:ribosomal protein L7/L12
MHPISLIFLGLCAFLLGFWLVRRLERRKVKSSGPQVIIPPSKSVHTSPVCSVEANRESSPIEPAQPADANREPAPVEHHDIRDLILENHQSEAIKLLHEQKGWDLEHAKEYVEQQEQRQSSKHLDPEVVAAAQKLLAENRKIVAIKLIYNHTGWSLKAAKDYVENSL